MAKLKDNVTGQIIEVPDNEVDKYLSQQMPTSGSVPPSYGQATTYQGQVQGTENPVVQSSIPDTQTGFTLAQHAAALKAAQAAGDTRAAAQIQSDFAKELDYQEKKTKLNDVITSNPTKAAKQNIEDLLGQYITVPKEQKGSWWNKFVSGLGWDIGESIAPEARTYESSKDALVTTLTPLLTAKGFTGVRAANILNDWRKLLPSVSDSEKTVDIKVNKLNLLIKNTLGEGLPQETLDTFKPGKSTKSSTDVNEYLDKYFPKKP